MHVWNSGDDLFFQLGLGSWFLFRRLHVSTKALPDPTSPNLTQSLTISHNLSQSHKSYS